jgi:uncharacterized surface protein with fasciclin (FAS1) repeats
MKTNRHLFSKRLMIAVLGLGTSVALAACGTPSDTTTSEPTTDETAATESDPMAEDEMAADVGNTVVDVAASNESFSTLVQAIEAAGLAETLSAEGPYTVFAPTNEAFAALPEGTLDQLLLPENQETLVQILTYHVVPAEVTSAEVTAGEVETVAGSTVNITVEEETGSIMVNDAMVVTPDVEASNGVIHAIDQVILPPDVAL